MSSPTNLSQEGVDALRHLRDRREVNTVILNHTDTPQALAVELEGNLTHDELLQALPSDEARLVVHELSFATREGTRRHETLLILWVPAGAVEQEEESYAVGYTALKELLADVHVHLTARRADQLDYRRLVALAG
ncbi:cofilin family protein [Streptomyces subrutilus]|uniref:cofilin family protein n=1 Tax=Streptomyces subrutilus TaxID=36818 RepID=UPI0033D23A0E